MEGPGKSEPEIGQGMTQAIKRCRGISAPLASSMAEMTEKTLAEKRQGRVKERKQESIGKGGNQQELETVLPAVQARGLKSEIGFGVAPSHLNLPTASVGSDERESLVNRGNGLIGEEIPGGSPVALSGDDEPKRDCGEIRMGDLGEIESQAPLTLAIGIPDFALT